MADTTTDVTVNPTSAVEVTDDLLTIDINSYGKDTTYGVLGEKVIVGSDGETTSQSKLNHIITGKGTDDDKYKYSYENDTDSQVNAYQYISKTKNGRETDSKRNMTVSVRDSDGNDLNLNGDTNTDSLGTNGGNEFKYNAGNLANEYSDYDEKGSIISTTKDEDGTTHYYVGSDEVSFDTGTDAFNTSDTLSGSFDHYNTVVKPLSLRN
jgi:hypothetical protein